MLAPPLVKSKFPVAFVVGVLGGVEVPSPTRNVFVSVSYPGSATSNVGTCAAVPRRTRILSTIFFPYNLNAYPPISIATGVTELPL